MNMKKLNRLLTGAVLLWLASCSEGMLDEAAQSGIQMPEDNGTAERRTVELQIQNKLQVSESSRDADRCSYSHHRRKRDNRHGYLRVRFRDRAWNLYLSGKIDLPCRTRGNGTQKGATSFILVTNGTDNKLSTARLSLKKGLYVKLYCVANSPELYVLDEQEKNMCQLCSNPW
jgi:hypothetical protein